MDLPFGVGGFDAMCQVEEKYPALLFKQQLTAYVEKIYGIIHDNLKKDIVALLNLCIQVFRKFPLREYLGAIKSNLDKK